jgi:radical SAM superfamily enzyme YgiQ (UPF0313 family)
MKILFGQSYTLRFDPKLWKAMQPYPPLGTLYAASYLRQKGYQVALFDAMLAASETEWEAALRQHRPDVAVLYEDNFNYLSKMCLLRMRQAAFTMLEMARRQGCVVIACGADATDHAAEYLARGAGWVLAGEGEATLGELLDCLAGRSDRPIDSILGLAWLPGKLEDGVARTPRRPELRDLDALPFPAWDLVDIERYRQIWLKKHGYYSINMVTTRGCPFHCNWCAKPIWGQRYHSRSPENVVEELSGLKATCRPDHIWFVDDILGLKPGWMARFADLVQAQGAQVPFKSLNRVDLLLRPGEVEALQRAGCETVWVGAESGSQQILDAMEKGTRIEQIEEATRRLHAAGIRVGYYLQFGYPGETRADIQATLDMVRANMPDDIGISVSYPLPGTRFYEAVKEGIGSQQNWVDSDDLAMLYKGTFTTAFYRQLHRTVHHEFRLRQAWRKVKAGAPAAPGPGSLRPKPTGPRRARAFLEILYHGLRLPLARLKLSRLEKVPHRSTPLRPQRLSPAEAATPSRALEYDE